MKQSEIVVLGLAGVAVFLILRSGQAAAKATASTPAKRTAEIFDSAGKPFENGWRYYDDGTAIDPAGNYYKGGQLIWSAPK